MCRSNNTLCWETTAALWETDSASDRPTDSLLDGPHVRETDGQMTLQTDRQMDRWCVAAGNVLRTEDCTVRLLSVCSTDRETTQPVWMNSVQMDLSPLSHHRGGWIARCTRFHRNVFINFFFWLPKKKKKTTALFWNYTVNLTMGLLINSSVLLHH